MRARMTQLCTAVLVGWLHASPAPAAPLFEDESALEAVLRGPLTRVYRQGPSVESEEMAGEWQYTTAAGAPVTLTIKLRQRGNTRRIACSTPPLRVNFVKGEVEGTLFDGQDKLKLVGVCDRDRDYRDYLWLEYLAYRAFALLTPASFDTRLLELRYADTSGSASMRRPAFFIEDIDALGDRLGLDALETRRVQPEALDPDAAALVELFAYMIGNTDFSTVFGAYGEDCCHNVKLLAGGEGGVVPVPYDFDAAGLVDAPYALPAKDLPIWNVRTRLFRGICKPRVHFERARARMLEREASITALFEENRAIGGRTRKRASRYLQRFFELLRDDGQFEQEVLANCISPEAGP